MWLYCSNKTPKVKKKKKKEVYSADVLELCLQGSALCMDGWRHIIMPNVVLVIIITVVMVVTVQFIFYYTPYTSETLNVLDIIKDFLINAQCLL